MLTLLIIIAKNHHRCQIAANEYPPPRPMQPQAAPRAPRLRARSRASEERPQRLVVVAVQPRVALPHRLAVSHGLARPAPLIPPIPIPLIPPISIPLIPPYIHPLDPPYIRRILSILNHIH